MTQLIVSELHNDVDEPEFNDRRKQSRRTSLGRRESDLAARCGVHEEAMKRLDQRCADRKEQNDQAWESQQKINDTVFRKIDGISNKLNWVLGAAYILWPLLLLLAQHFMKK